jgi:hypothetical protein
MRWLAIPALLLRRVARIMYSGGDVVNGLADRFAAPTPIEPRAIPSPPPVSSPGGPPNHWLERVQHIPAGHWIVLGTRLAQAPRQKAPPAPPLGPDAAPVDDQNLAAGESSNSLRDRPASQQQRPRPPLASGDERQARPVNVEGQSQKNTPRSGRRLSAARRGTQQSPATIRAPGQQEGHAPHENLDRDPGPDTEQQAGAPAQSRNNVPPDLTPPRPARLRPPSRPVEQHPSQAVPSRLSTRHETEQAGARTGRRAATPDSRAESPSHQPRRTEGAPALSRQVVEPPRPEFASPAPWASQEINMEVVPESAAGEYRAVRSAAEQPGDARTYAERHLPITAPSSSYSAAEPGQHRDSVEELAWSKASAPPKVWAEGESAWREEIPSRWPTLPEQDERYATERQLAVEWSRLRQEWQRQARLDSEQQGASWNEWLF